MRPHTTKRRNRVENGDKSNLGSGSFGVYDIKNDDGGLFNYLHDRIMSHFKYGDELKLFSLNSALFQIIF